MVKQKSDAVQNQQQAADTTDNAGGQNHAGTAKFTTIKAGCGIRFDPDILDEDAGFDFSAAPELKDALPDSADNLPDSSET